MKQIIIRSIADDRKVVTVLDLDSLYKYISKHVSVEFSNLVEPCYYPKTSNIFKDLLNMCNTDEKTLIQYSIEKYGEQRSQFKLVHDPYTTLLILIVQEYLKIHNLAAAQQTFHLFSLRTYSNTLYHFTTSKKNGNKKALCINDIFTSALESLSNNHIFKKKKTIASSIIYFSSDVFSKYKTAMAEDDSNKIFRMIYSLKNRIKQSVRSLMNKYYDIYKNKNSNSTKDNPDYDPTKETRLKNFISRVSEDMCVYRKRNSVAIQTAQSITKFNKKLSVEFAETIAQPRFLDDVNTAYYLLLKDLKDLSVIKQTQFLQYIKSNMSIKSTKQKVYFKMIIDRILQNIIMELQLDSWYNGLTIQSKGVSRNFIAYYLAIYLRYYV